MPRVKQLADKYKTNDLAFVIRKYQFAGGYTIATAAKALGMSAPTWARYLKDPSTLSLKTLRTVCKVLKIPKEEVLPNLI